MTTISFGVNKETLLDLQRLYDIFIYDKRSGRYLKSMSVEFQNIQRSNYKKEAFTVYDKLFQTSRTEGLLTIVRETNRLMSKLMVKFGNFPHDPEFIRVDPLDEILLYDFIDSILANEAQSPPTTM